MEINVAPKTEGPEISPEWHSRSSYDGELEKQVDVGTTVQLKRRLQSRHLQMIAIGMQKSILFSNTTFTDKNSRRNHWYRIVYRLSTSLWYIYHVLFCASVTRASIRRRRGRYFTSAKRNLNRRPSSIIACTQADTIKIMQSSMEIRNVF